jgi:hypothetical protein
MEQRFRLELDEILFLGGVQGTIGIVKSGSKRQIFVETATDEMVMTLTPDDLLVASGFGPATTIARAVRCTLYLIRDASSPLIVLSRDHPASSRLNVVVSVGLRTVVRCDIQKGTHPEQDVLCGPVEFHGLEIISAAGEVLLRGEHPFVVERQKF